MDASGAGYGAIGGATSALLANQIAGFVTDGQGNPNQTQLATITALSMLAGGGVASLLGQNASAAALAAQNETLNNTCAAGHNCGTLKSALADTGRAAWNTVVGTVEAVPNFLSGALPGYPDYVPFLGGARLPYDDPDFGDVVSFLGALGAAKIAGAGSEVPNQAIQFGANENQSYHTFRHVVNGGYDATAVQRAVTGDLSNIGASLPQGQYTGTVVVNGTAFKYSAFKLPDGTINVGRITPPR